MKPAWGLWLLGVGCSSTPAVQPNVILISVDTLRADRVTEALMPTLVSLQKQGTYFSNAFSPANESLFAHASIFTGKKASDWGELDYESYRLPEEAITLASRFSDAGYRTQAAAGGGHLSAVFGLDVGFEEYQTGSHFAGFAQTIPMALEALNRPGEEPMFLFVHGYDCHTPYIKPGPAGRAMTPEYEGPLLELAHDPLTYERIYNDIYAPDFKPDQIFTDGGPSFLSTEIFAALPKHIADPTTRKIKLSKEDIDFLKGTYDSAVLYADMWLEIFFEALRRQDRWDNTVVAVISDHGEDLLDHGVINHRAGLWNSTTHVPMIITGPGIPHQSIDQVVSTRDLGSSLLSAAGLQSSDFPGSDWIHDPPGERPPVVSEGMGLQSVIR